METKYRVSKTGGPDSANTKETQMLNSTFNLDQRYELTEPLGTGAYGVVCEAIDNTSGEKYAIKKIEKAFEHATFTKRTLRELKILRLLNHDNVIGIKTIQLPPSRQDFKDIYVINELMETDLRNLIKSEQELTDEHNQFFIYQVLRGMKYMHSAQILHRDMKPRNLLINSNCDLKICDFGLARANLPDLKFKATPMTDYIATRWYRAPELLLSCKTYGEAVDVWSVGCILAELLGRRAIFPGKDTQHQLEIILNVIGTPTPEEIEAIPRVKSRQFMKSLDKKKGKGFEKLFPDANPLSIDLLKKLMTFDPQKRLTVEQALEHPYLSSLHFPEDEPTTSPVSKYDFLFERQLLSGNELKDLIYDEILLYHFPEKVEEYERNKEKYETQERPFDAEVIFVIQGEESTNTGETSSDTDFF